MKKKKKSPGPAGVEVAQIIPLKDLGRMKPARRRSKMKHAVVIFNSRISSTNRLSYSGVMSRLLSRITAAVPDLHPEEETRQNLIKLRDALQKGKFRDTAKIQSNTSQLNHALAKAWPEFQPLLLIEVKTQTEIEDYANLVREERIWPVAAIIGGSPQMVADVCHERWMYVFMGVIRRMLEQRIPILGICFGGQLLCYMEFSALVHDHRVPEGVHYEHIKSLNRYERVVPGTPRAIYGSREIEVLPGQDIQHPIMYGLPRLQMLTAHWQGLELEDRKIPFGQVLAVSKRKFVDDPTTPKVVVEQTIIEVVVFGSAVICISHPEIEPELLDGLTHLPRFKEALEKGGVSISTVIEELRRHPSGKPWAGDQLLRNFLFRMVGHYHISRLVDSGRISNEQGVSLLRALQVNLQG